MALLQVPFTVVSGLIGLFTSTGLRGADYNATCQEIATAVSSASSMHYDGSSYFTRNIESWSTTNSQTSACSFEPANAQDVGIAFQILAKDQTPFAVRGGGHSSNPGFSSTPGVQIVMRSFSEVVYDQDTQTAIIGMGLVWDDVYLALEQYNVTVVGGKSSGVGVGGFVLGGGYSYLSNEYGLSLDNIVSLELVMPNGTVTNITNSSNPDLFYGLRGEFNNFGVVTTVTIKTYPQSQIWGGSIIFAQDHWDEVNNAMANFVSTLTDPKACVYGTVDYVHLTYQVPAIETILFYDGPTQPDGIFNEFLAIPSLTSDVTTRTFLDLIQAFPATSPSRFVTHWVPLEEFTLSMMQMVENQTLFYGEKLSELSALVVSYDLVPLMPSLYSHSDTPSAFPSLRGPEQGHSFIKVIIGWTDASNDDAILQLGAESTAYMKQFAVDAGQDVANALLYPNAAPPNAALVDMYGNALDRLHSIKSAVDPDNVMGLAGGWKF